MKFLQCSDLHIGAAAAEGRDEDVSRAFFSIAQDAVANDVDFMLICGDLFDRRDVSATALRQASTALALLRNQGIPVFAIEGNHDKALYRNRESWMGYLDSMGFLRLLRTPSDAIYQEGENAVFFQGIRIIGMEYQGARSQERILALLEAIPEYQGRSILMVHAPIDQMAGFDYAFIDSTALQKYRNKADYIAAGHIHRQYEVEGWIYNPGAPECVKMEEGIKGEKGYYLTEIGPDGLSTKFIPYPHRRVIQRRIDISAAQAVEQAQNTILAQQSPEDKEACMMLTVTGTCIFDPVELDIASMERTIQQEWECYSVKIQLLAQKRDQGGDIIPLSQEDIQQRVVEQLLEEQGIYDAHCAKHVLAIKQALLESEEETQQIRAILGNFL